MPKATFKLWPDRKCRYCGHLIKGGRYAGVSLANHIRFNHRRPSGVRKTQALSQGAAQVAKEGKFLALLFAVTQTAQQLNAARAHLRELHRQLSAIKF